MLFPRICSRSLATTRHHLCRFRRPLLLPLKKRLFCASSNSTTEDPYTSYYNDDMYKDISELNQFQKLINQIDNGQCTSHVNDVFTDKLDFSKKDSLLSQIGLSASDYLALFDSALITHCLHIESRIAAFQGQGFYTIGPCGEECVAPAGYLLANTDAMALHYRHLSACIARQINREMKKSSNEKYGDLNNGTKTYSLVQRIIRDRARGYVVSMNDPIGGASHCLLGSNDFDHDFLVTSTLASQLPPALGRALGASLYSRMGLPIENAKFPMSSNNNNDSEKDGFVSFVTVGDGSVNNAHFLTAINKATYAIHNKMDCPLLIGISNNKLSISLKDESNWLESFVNRYMSYFPKYNCDGTNMLNVYYTFNESLNYVKSNKKPAMIIFNDLPRQFGHAATDRQAAYLTTDEIKAYADRSVLSMLCYQCGPSYLNILSYNDIKQRLLKIASIVKNEFAEAKLEPKLVNTKENRQLIISKNSQPIVQGYNAVTQDTFENKFIPNIDIISRKKNLMRKLMNASIEEVLLRYDNSVYIGEDVRHGGYYLVTEGLSEKYHKRILDFPPDETTIFGCGIGFSQSGLLPIVEMPYAKYLDCGADMFFESLVMNWLSNGQQPNGMLIRLQGFANGLFGGNFHTHNSLYLAPGLDVVCYSNGADYIRGMRYNMEQVNNGRIVMSVDCTALLNARHVYNDLKDSQLMLPYPNKNEFLTFDDCILYMAPNFEIDNKNITKLKSFDKIILTNNLDLLKNEKVTERQVKYSNANSFEFDSGNNSDECFIIVSYGLGVQIAREAQRELQLTHGYSNVIVIDTPYLSNPPKQFVDYLNQICKKYPNNSYIVFADICKEGQNPLNGYITKLQNNGVLTKFKHWLSIAAQFSYNPLGQDLTFLNKQDIVDTVLRLT